MRPIFRIPLTLAVIFLFVHSEALALGPGVPYGSSAGGITGSFTGLLIPGTAGTDRDPSEPFPADLLIGTNALGLFSFAVGTSGLVNGTAIFFLDDVAFNSTVIGVSDSRKRQVIAGANLISVDRFGGTTATAVYLGGSGRILATLTDGGGRGTRNLTGSASVSADTRDFLAPSADYSFIVDGVQQSTSVSTSADLSIESTIGN